MDDSLQGCPQIRTSDTEDLRLTAVWSFQEDMEEIVTRWTSNEAKSTAVPVKLCC